MLIPLALCQSLKSLLTLSSQVFFFIFCQSTSGYSPRRTENDDNENDEIDNVICVGGRNKSARNKPNRQAVKFIDFINNQDGVNLEAIDATEEDIGAPCGKTRISNTRTLPRLSGSSKNNITNLNPNGEGLQLEFHLDMLKGLATDSDNPKYQSYQEAILNAIAEAVKEQNS